MSMSSNVEEKDGNFKRGETAKYSNGGSEI